MKIHQFWNLFTSRFNIVMELNLLTTLRMVNSRYRLAAALIFCCSFFGIQINTCIITSAWRKFEQQNIVPKRGVLKKWKLLLSTCMTFLKKKKDCKDRVMGPLLILVCNCFRTNVIVLCKIVSFSCSFYKFVLQNAIVFNFRKQHFKMALIWKEVLFLTHLSHFLVTREKTENSFSTYLTYIKPHISSPFNLFYL